MKRALVTLAMFLMLPILTNIAGTDAGIEAEYQQLKRQNDAYMYDVELREKCDRLDQLMQRYTEATETLPE